MEKEEVEECGVDSQEVNTALELSALIRESSVWLGYIQGSVSVLDDRRISYLWG